MKKLTIFTPTYNRGYKLHDLYDSLLRQTSMEYEWVMVDDGSTDNTKEFATKVLKDDIIDFKYIYQPNSGKPQAINLGAQESNCDYFMCVDSDDTISENCVEVLINTISKIENKSSCIGIITLRENLKNKLKSNYKNLNGNMIKLQDLYYKYGFKGETTLVIRTDYLKKYPYPNFSNEKFIPETWQYDILDSIGDWLYLSDVVCYYQYLPDGYTSNFVKLVLSNPKGYKEFSKQRMKISKVLFARLKGGLYYDLCCIIEKKYEINLKNNFCIRMIMYPLAIIIYKLKGYKNEKN